MYVKHLVIHTLLTTMMLTLGFVITPSAQAAGPVVTNTKFPVNNTVFVPCANNGQGDTIQLSGALHVLFIVTLDNNGGFTLHITTDGQDVTGVSTITGVKYQGAVGDSLTINGKVGFVHTAITPHNSFILIGQGTASNLIEQFVMHLTVNPDGTVTSSFESENIRCM